MIKLSGKYSKDVMIKHLHKYQIFIRLCCIFLTAFLMLGIMPATAKAATGLKLYDYSTKKTSTYTGKQVTVTLNGTTLASVGTPGILVDGVALLPYYEIFKTSAIAADCTYNSTKGTITLSKYNTTIVMTIGSKTATVNGKKVTMSVAPKKIKYVASGKVRVLVPSRFVSETLGLGYTWYSDKNIIAIQKKTLLLSYNGGKKFEYTGAKGKVTIDGKNISLGTMPSIIVNNTAMLRASKVFTDSAIGAKYNYNKADKTVTFTKDDIVLVMTLGSTTAYLNDKKMTLSTAPMLVTNCETNTSYVMVPGSFTATSLGFDYTWNNPAITSEITTKSSGDDAELGDSGDISETGTILNTWTAEQNQYRTGSNIHEINPSAGTTINYGTIYSVTRDYTNSSKNSETFLVYASAPFNKLLSESNGNKITITSDNELCSTQTISMYGTYSNFVNTITLNNHTEGIGTTLELELMQENYSYDLSLSTDGLILSVTVYYNALTSATIGTNSDGDYLVLTGIDALKASITEGNGCITIDIPNTVNSIGDISTSISGAQYISQLLSINAADKTQLLLTLKDGYKYYYSESGNKLTITFQPGKETTVIDKSKYEIVIPKPAAVTSSMISDMDYYLSNYFVITLTGDYTSELTTDRITNGASVVKKLTVTRNSAGNTEIKITTSKLQGYEIASDSNNIYVNVGNPREIYKNIVVLDPGHGGPATGATQNGNYEKDINLKILYTIGKEYFNRDPSKLKVYYTRTSDVDVTLDNRAAFASKVGADLFISLHMNAAVNAPKACGTEIFYSSVNNSPNSAGLTSQKLATMLLANLYPAIGTSNRGVKEGALVVTKKNTVPAVLIELGFLTNTTDYAIIMDEAKQRLAMESLYNSLLQIFEKYPTGR